MNPAVHYKTYWGGRAENGQKSESRIVDDRGRGHKTVSSLSRRGEPAHLRRASQICRDRIFLASASSNFARIAHVVPDAAIARRP